MNILLCHSESRSRGAKDLLASGEGILPTPRISVAGQDDKKTLTQ